MSEIKCPQCGAVAYHSGYLMVEYHKDGESLTAHRHDIGNAPEISVCREHRPFFRFRADGQPYDEKDHSENHRRYHAAHPPPQPPTKKAKSRETAPPTIKQPMQKQVFADPFVIHLSDCVQGMAERMEPDAADLCVTSIPFGALFSYSGKDADIGNCADGADDMRASEFGLHLRFFTEQLYRVMTPGRNACIHIQQLLRYKNQHGYMGRRDFRGAVVDIFTAAGFQWTGEVAIPKDPQMAAQRLNMHSLQFTTGHSRDACALAPWVNDYVMIFQKPGINPRPVHCIQHRDKNPNGWVSMEQWIKWASGVWGDIRETDVLEGWQGAREEGDEKHVCPLQLEVIRRCVRLYSSPGDLILDPFMGIGSTAYVALQEGRRAVGFELKDSYHRQAVRNCESLSGTKKGTLRQTTIFDFEHFGDTSLPPAVKTRDEIREMYPNPPATMLDLAKKLYPEETARLINAAKPILDSAGKPETHPPEEWRGFANIPAESLGVAHHMMNFARAAKRTGKADKVGGDTPDFAAILRYKNEIMGRVASLKPVGDAEEWEKATQILENSFSIGEGDYARSA